jgi:peptide/nickel transport system ATP-binding protein
MKSDPLLSVRDVVVTYKGNVRHRPLVALDGASLDVTRGEVLAILGASGSGKSTLARVVLGLQKCVRGVVTLKGKIWPPRNRRERTQIQAVFQDHFDSFDPRMSVLQVMAEGVISQGLAASAKEVSALIEPLLQRVGLHSGFLPRAARSLSGGERQRLALARALSLSPEVLVLDEPVSALDASLRLGALHLIKELAVERDLAILLITHDLDVLKALADRYVVLLGGRLVEEGQVHAGDFAPIHPWTQLLAAADAGSLVVQDEEDRSKACSFLSCPRRLQRCENERPLLREIANSHAVACHDPESPPLTASTIE